MSGVIAQKMGDFSAAVSLNPSGRASNGNIFARKTSGRRMKGLGFSAPAKRIKNA